MEKWNQIKGYEGIYEVSTFGNVRSIDREVLAHNCKRVLYLKGKQLKPAINKDGYKRVGLCKNRKNKSFSIHRLVATTFLNKPEYKSEVNHKDGNKLNNKVDNLEWITHSENVKHAFHNGLAKKMIGSLNHKAKLSEDDVREIRNIAAQKRNYGRKEIAKRFGVTEKHIQDIVNSKTLWKHV